MEPWHLLGGHPSPWAAFTHPSLLGPCFWGLRGKQTVGSPRCRRGVAPSPSPPSSPGCVGLGAEQLFWRLPDNSALYLPPVPPNTLVSAAALCCKFPWSNYVLIYDNPGRAVEGGQAPVKFGSCPPGPEGPPWLLPTVNSSLDHELLRAGGWGEHPRASPSRERGCSRGKRRVRPRAAGNWCQLAGPERPQRRGRCVPSHRPSRSSGSSWGHPGVRPGCCVRVPVLAPPARRESLPSPSPWHRSGVGPDPSPFPALNGSSRLCLEGLLPAK